MFVLLVLLSFVGWHAVRAINHPHVENSDQINIGAMVLKTLRPELLARDYFFKDPSVFAFYTPAFVALAAKLTQFTGSFDSALATLVPFVLLIYISGMCVLVFSMTQSVWLAAFIAMLSSVQQWTIGGTFWGVIPLPAMLPRALFLCSTPWLTLALFRLLERPRLFSLVGFGLLVGMLGNLHPVSGFHFSQLVLMIWLIRQGNGTDRIWGALLVAGSAFVGVSPTLVSFYVGTRVYTAPDVSFERFYEILHERFETFFPPGVFSFYGIELDGSRQALACWV
jgi:hypothetical protein